MDTLAILKITQFRKQKDGAMSVLHGISRTENQTGLDMRCYCYKMGTLSIEVVRETSQWHHATEGVTSLKHNKKDF